MKSKIILVLSAGIIGLLANANAAYVNYYATWSGGSFGNSASAYASFKLDTDYLTTNGSAGSPGGSDGLPSWITDIDLTVTGAASGNGHFTSADFGGAIFTAFGPVDFSQELVGQTNFADFNLFGAFNPETGMPSAPQGWSPNVLAVNLAAFNPEGGGRPESMQLTSLSTSAVPEATTSLGLLALGAGGALTRRRQKRAA